MSAKVTIIVPIYNVEKYLNRCMTSLLNQTLKDIEIIMVDDGSPDRCPQMCDEYAKRDSRVKVVHKKNAGLGYARNSGLDVATGEYVAFVDSDDFVDTRMYETLYRVATEKKCEVVFCGFVKEFAQGAFQSVSECSEYTEYSGSEVNRLIPDFIASPPYEKSEYRHDMSVWHSIYRRDIIQEHDLKFISERDYASEDIPFQIDFLSHCSKVGFIPDLLYTYCYNNGSLTKKVSLEKFEKIKALYHLLKDKSQDYDKEGLRAQRLFIGYVRAMIRTEMRADASSKEKHNFVKSIITDDVWKEIKQTYKLSYLPKHQRIILWTIYKRKARLTSSLCHLLDLKIITKCKKMGGAAFILLYYGFAQWLPGSYSPFGGKFANKIRIMCVKHIFRRCGNISTMDRRAYFGNGFNIEIGDFSGIGERCVVPNNTIIGKYVMMAPEVHIVANNHNFSDTSKPMCEQGSPENPPVTIIEDDCWIGVRVIMTPGRHVRKGSIVAAGAVLTKDFDDYSIVGGNPAKLIRNRNK